MKLRQQRSPMVMAKLVCMVLNSKLCSTTLTFCKMWCTEFVVILLYPWKSLQCDKDRSVHYNEQIFYSLFGLSQMSLLSLQCSHKLRTTLIRIPNVYLCCKYNVCSTFINNISSQLHTLHFPLRARWLDRELVSPLGLNGREILQNTSLNMCVCPTLMLKCHFRKSGGLRLHLETSIIFIWSAGWKRARETHNNRSEG